MTDSVTVLLIGSTGNGKSTLGNFLLNPAEEHIYDQQSFITARSNLPQTQNVKYVQQVVSVEDCDKKFPLGVIDTPGLNESAEQDHRHMTDIITRTEGLRKLHACVLVIKFNSTIDSQYKATVKYYSKLLPYLFDRNVIIVMTNFATDERAIRKREREHVNVEQVEKYTLEEVVESGGLSYNPPVFKMDCLPDDDEERKINLSVRSALLQYVCSLKPMKLTCLRGVKYHYRIITDSVTVLLIGSTGNGKSTLGNFLINPAEEHIYDQQSFITARSHLPQTQNVSYVQQVVSVEDCDKKFPLVVIDTPGLNVSPEHDLSHMTDIITFIEEHGKVQACVLVVKFNSKIDAQYKATVKYYSKLLPYLFDKNVIIVMTGFATNERAIRKREREHVDVEQVKNNALREVVESGGLAYRPPVFRMNCLPDDDEERKINLSERSALLQYVCSLKPIELACLRVPKTEDLLRLDEIRMRKLEGEIAGYNARLQEVTQKLQASKVLAEIETEEANITAATEKLKSLQAQLEDLDTSDMVIAAQWSVSEEWKLLKTQSKLFKLKSPYEIKNVVTWTNGKSKIYYKRSDPDRLVWGTVVGDYMCGLYATVTVETYKRLKYEDRIVALRREFANQKAKKIKLEAHLKEIQEANTEYAKQLENLRAYISEKRKQLDAISSDLMTIEVARKRLEDLRLY